MKCRLKIILIERGIKQKQFAELVGMKEPQLSRMATGTVIPTLPIAFRIAQALELKIEDIWQPE